MQWSLSCPWDDEACQDAKGLVVRLWHWLAHPEAEDTVCLSPALRPLLLCSCFSKCPGLRSVLISTLAASTCCPFPFSFLSFPSAVPVFFCGLWHLTSPSGCSTPDFWSAILKTPSLFHSCLWLLLSLWVLVLCGFLLYFRLEGRSDWHVWSRLPLNPPTSDFPRSHFSRPGPGHYAKMVSTFSLASLQLIFHKAAVLIFVN